MKASNRLRHLPESHLQSEVLMMGGSVTLRRMPTVKFAQDAADYFVEVLTILCRASARLTKWPRLLFPRNDA